MKRFLRKSGIKVAAAVLVVVLLVVVSRSILDGQAGLMADVSGGVTSPVKRAASAAVDWIEGIYGYIYKYDQLVAENNELRSELATAQQAAANAAEYEEENQNLRDLLNFSQKHSDYVFESAKIISWSSSNWSSSFTISKGSSNAQNAIKTGDCVVTEYGALVGQIIEVGDTWCTVRTIVDSEIEVGALVGESEAAGMCIGDFALMQKQCLKLTYLATGAQLLEGDAVLTSGKGTNIPQGLVIGYIKSVLSEANGQTLYGVVEPACDLGTLSEVYIITDFSATE